MLSGQITDTDESRGAVLTCPLCLLALSDGVAFSRNTGDGQADMANLSPLQQLAAEFPFHKMKVSLESGYLTQASMSFCNIIYELLIYVINNN